MSVSHTISEIFSIEEWSDLETGGRGHSRSSKIAPFDRSYKTFYWSAIISIALCLDRIPACDRQMDRQTS